MEKAEATFEAGAVLQLVSFVKKSLFLLFTKQQNGCSSLLEAFLTIPLLFSLQN